MSEPGSRARRRPSPWAIVSSALVIGLAAGGVTGLVIGTAIVPILGTAFGGAIGAVVGAWTGVVTGVVLAGLSAWTRSSLAARSVAAITDGGLGVLAVVRLDDTFPDWGGGLFVVWCFALGAVFGARASNPGRIRPSARSVSRPGRYASFGAMIGSLAGGIVGLAIGLAAYPPTSPFAFVEGAILGAVPGAVVGVSAAVVHPHESTGEHQ